jgi:hypothetical protein
MNVSRQGIRLAFGVLAITIILILVSVTIDTGAAHSATFTDTFQESQRLTNTAADPDNNTSEFSECEPECRVCLPMLYNNYCHNFYDDFSNPASGWAVGEDEYARYGYVYGEYQIRSKRSGYFYTFSAPTCKRQKFVVEVDTRWVGQPGNSVGIFFVMTESYHWDFYYIFDISTDYQMYRLLRRDPGGWVEVVYPTSSGAINGGNSVNHLKVTINGQDIDLEINGIELDSEYVSVYDEWSSAGIVSSPYSSQPVSDARFDNFSLVELPGEGTLSGTDNSVESSGRGADRRSYALLRDHPDWDWYLEERS